MINLGKDFNPKNTFSEKAPGSSIIYGFYSLIRC